MDKPEPTAEQHPAVSIDHLWHKDENGRLTAIGHLQVASEFPNQKFATSDEYFTARILRDAEANSMNRMLFGTPNYAFWRERGEGLIEEQITLFAGLNPLGWRLLPIQYHLCGNGHTFAENSDICYRAAGRGDFSSRLAEEHEIIPPKNAKGEIVRDRRQLRVVGLVEFQAWWQRGKKWSVPGLAVCESSMPVAGSLDESCNVHHERLAAAADMKRAQWRNLGLRDLRKPDIVDDADIIAATGHKYARSTREKLAQDWARARGVTFAGGQEPSDLEPPTPVQIP